MEGYVHFQPSNRSYQQTRNEEGAGTHSAPTPDAAAPPREELENCRKELLESEKQALWRCHLRVKTVTAEN